MNVVFDLKNMDRVPACIRVGMQAAKRGDYNEARQMFRASIVQLQDTAGEQGRVIELIVRTADTYCSEGRLDRAKIWYSRALSLSQQVNRENTMQAACLTTKVAEINVLQSQMAEYRKNFESVQHIYLLCDEEGVDLFLGLLIDLSWTLCIQGQANEALFVNDFIAQIKLEQEELGECESLMSMSKCG